MSVIKWVIGVPVGLFAAMLLLGAILKGTESGAYAAPTAKQQAEYAASECWKSYERKSLSPLEKRQIASFCEAMDQRAKDTK